MGKYGTLIKYPKLESHCLVYIIVIGKYSQYYSSEVIAVESKIQCQQNKNDSNLNLNCFPILNSEGTIWVQNLNCPLYYNPKKLKANISKLKSIEIKV